MRNIIFCIILLSFGLITSCNSTAQKEAEKDFGEMAWQKSAIPIRPGEPGKVPFWNAYSKRFIYAPAFNYDKIENADKYHYEILSLKDSSTYEFEKDVPYAPLSPVWAKVPVGEFKIKVIGVSANGDSLGLAGQGQYYRASPYDPEDSAYHKPVMPYDSSAMIALDKLMHKDYVNYWLTHKSPDPDYVNYKYPAKIWSALIVGAVTHAKLKPNTDEAKRSTQLAKIIADFLIKVSFKEGSAWEFFPPTYYGKRISEHPNPRKPHMKLTTNFTIMGADAGNAYLDLYDYIGNEKYLEAAKRIAQTYLKTQLDNGSWYEMVNYKTGKPVAPNIAIPTAMINYYDRLRKDYKVDGLEESTEKALNWIMQNPVKTFNWQGQFEDVKPRKPYQNQSREQACDLAIYLFKNKKNIPLAEDLVRFAEDQFVIWEQPRDFWVGKKRPSRKGYHSINWITPCVQEQYVYWMPVGRSAGIMLQTFWEAYSATQKKIYLAKAKSIANAFTLVQKANHGDYPTFFTKYPMSRWLNSTVYPAKIMMALEQNLKQ